jgi:hypothetical protein
VERNFDSLSVKNFPSLFPLFSVSLKRYISSPKLLYTVSIAALPVSPQHLILLDNSNGARRRSTSPTFHPPPTQPQIASPVY